MVPVYAAIAIFSLMVILRWRKPKKEHRSSILKGIFGVLILLLILVPPVVFPIPNLQEPSGEYGVGTKTVYLQDFSRDEVYTEDPSDVRELNVQIWYPATRDSKGILAPYLSNLKLAGPAFAEFLGLPNFVLNHVNLIETHSILEVPVAPEGGPYPVLIFSHGWGGTRTQSTFLMEELASHGYVVAAIDHPFGALVTVYPDGKVVFQKKDILSDHDSDEVDAVSAQELLSTWTGDVLFVLDQLEGMNASSDETTFSTHLDLKRVGFLGHSTGGGNAVQSCWAESRCVAGLAMDAWLVPVSDDVIESQIDQPFMFLWSEDWGSEENKDLFDNVYGDLGDVGYRLTIVGTRHYDFSDLPLLSPLSPWFGLKGPIDGRLVLEIVSAYSVAFFDEHLKGHESELLRGGSAEYSEVEFEFKGP
jgi:dienelactone hydrolase